MRFKANIQRMNANERTQRGLSLLEVLGATAIATIVFGVGLPSMQPVLQKYTLRAAANEIANSIEYARSRAILKNKAVTYSISSGHFGATGDDTGGFTTQGLASGLTLTPTTPITLTLKSNGTVTPQTTLTLKNSQNMTVTITIYSSGKTKVSEVTP